ncbi:MAG: SH3 domain-containing protein [Saprospiraceae bacterium]|nr:SH3 domain-containing protein [Saprospiraceae bacterium]
MKKFKTPIFPLYALIIAFLISSCKNETQPPSKTDETSTNTSKVADKQPETTSLPTSSLETNDNLYAWVDKLRIRDKSSTKGKAITQVQSKDALVFTGEKSSTSETIVLRGVAYHEPWLKVKAPDDKIGWVFGGAVKKKGEEKGNDIIDDINFSFPYFGKYDLNDWKNLGSKDESGGDAEITTTIYQKGLKFIEVSIVEVGDYGYSRNYKLMDDKKNILRERRLNFSADVDFRELTETVKDYTASPNKIYSRTQKIEKHHSQLNAKPILVNGEWQESELK